MSRPDLKKGRTNQKLRTRKALIEAAARLVAAGRPVTIPEVADEAKVSRATAYRYFPSPDALLLETELHQLVTPPEAMFPDRSGDPGLRAARVMEHLHRLTADREPAFRQFMRGVMDRWLTQEGKVDSPLRGGRRMALLEAALAPGDDELTPAARERLILVLAMMVGQETYFAGRDVCQMSPEEIRSALAWAIDALVRASLAESRTRRI
ncbi:MAG: TetR/AcrR family transcriptional regulator [Candidatus Krumholzibacteriia bacterium]